MTPSARHEVVEASELRLCQREGSRGPAPPGSPAEPHLSLAAGELLPNLTELREGLQSLTPHSGPDPARSSKPQSSTLARKVGGPLWAPVALFGRSRGMKGRRIPLQRPPLSSPVWVGVSQVPPLDQAGSSLGLTGLAHAAGPHHGDLDEPAARSPQAAVGSGAARDGVLCDRTHVLDEAHRRYGRAARSGEESQARRRLALRGEEGTRSDAARAGTGRTGREREETRGSAVPARGWDRSHPGADFLRPRPRLHSSSQSPGAPLEAPPTACTTRLRPCRSRERVRSPVRSEENRAAGARVATCGTQPAPAALARGRTGGCGVTGSQIRVGDLSVSAGFQVRMGGLCPCLPMKPVMSAGSQIRGGFRGTHPCLPTSPLGLRRSVPRHSLN